METLLVDVMKVNE